MSSDHKPSIEKFDQQSSEEQTQYMEQYYKLQSKIYDATRWSFLFGRKRIIRDLPLSKKRTSRILEVGCGTGYNLVRLAKQFPNAELIGLDVSSDMTALSEKNTRAFSERVRIIQAPYENKHQLFEGQVDAVLFSYSLTMINPQWSELILQAREDLKSGGLIAVTDFHDSKNQWFKKHMSNHHVRMDGHLLPLLEKEFTPIISEVPAAYGGIWHYLVFIGKK